MNGRKSGRWASRAVVAVAMVCGVVALNAGVAQAWHPDISATARCDLATGTYVIDYTSTAWEGFGSDPLNDTSRENTQIDIAFDGVVVASQPFVRPTYSFSGTAPVPAGKGPGDVVVVTATSVGLWGGSFSDVSSRSVDVTIPADECDGFVPALGRFTGGGSQIRVDAARVTGGTSDNGKVTRGLTIHCDRLLSNNLEVNWNGNRFHMEDHLDTVASRSSRPAPRRAPQRFAIGRRTPPSPSGVRAGLRATRCRTGAPPGRASTRHPDRPVQEVAGGTGTNQPATSTTTSVVPAWL